MSKSHNNQLRLKRLGLEVANPMPENIIPALLTRDGCDHCGCTCGELFETPSEDGRMLCGHCLDTEGY